MRHMKTLILFEYSWESRLRHDTAKRGAHTLTLEQYSNLLNCSTFWDNTNFMAFFMAFFFISNVLVETHSSGTSWFLKSIDVGCAEYNYIPSIFRFCLLKTMQKLISTTFSSSCKIAVYCQCYPKATQSPICKHGSSEKAEKRQCIRLYFPLQNEQGDWGTWVADQGFVEWYLWHRLPFHRDSSLQIKPLVSVRGNRIQRSG